MIAGQTFFFFIVPSEMKMILKKEWNNLPADELQLLERKGVFPYDFVDSWEKLNYKSLPTRKSFYSKLSDSNISEDEYEFAEKVWNTFNIQNLGEYSDLYLKTDVLLLADVCENFQFNIVRCQV